MVFHFAQAKQKWSGQVHFLGASSPDSSRRIASLFKFALCRSRVCSQMWACLHHQTPPEGSLRFLNSLFAARACAPKCEPACRLGYPSLLLFFLKINFVSLLSEQVLFKVLIWAVLRNIGWRLWKYSISPVQVIIIWHFSCSCWLFKTRVHIIMTKQNLWVIVKLTNLE